MRAAGDRRPATKLEVGYRRPRRRPSGLTRERNHEVALPTSRDVRDNDRSQELTRLRDSLQELTDLLAPQRNCESAPSREKVPEEDPGWEDPGWATARMNLGVAYRDRLVGDRSDNLKRAICAIEDSLSVWTRERNPEEWAATHMNFGMAYRERFAGHRSENRKRAIACFENALSVWTRKRHPKEIAAARAPRDSVPGALWRVVGEPSSQRRPGSAASGNGLPPGRGCGAAPRSPVGCEPRR